MTRAGVWLDIIGDVTRRAGGEVVAFDIDGTLVDHDRAAASAFERWALDEGWLRGDELDDLVAAWSRIAEAAFAAYERGELTFAAQRRVRLREFLPLIGVDGSRWPDERLDETFAAFLAAYQDAWEAYPDAAPCLAALRPVARIAAVSNGEYAQQVHKLVATGLGGRFEHVLTSDRLGRAKPDPAIFLEACQWLGVEPAAVVYVGDRLDVDVRPAAEAGLRAIWLNRDERRVPRGVESVLGLSELPVLLGRPRTVG